MTQNIHMRQNTLLDRKQKDTKKTWWMSIKFSDFIKITDILFRLLHLSQVRSLQAHRSSHQDFSHEYESH